MDITLHELFEADVRDGYDADYPTWRIEQAEAAAEQHQDEMRDRL